MVSFRPWTDSRCTIQKGAKIQTPDIIQLAIAIVAFAALIVSIHAQRRLSRLSGMQFPGVTAVWAALHKAGPREAMPPLLRDTYEIQLKLTEKLGHFSIDKVCLTRWDAYWAQYKFSFRLNEGGAAAYVERLKGDRGAIPKFLRVRVERRGGVQAACWQTVRIENLPS